MSYSAYSDYLDNLRPRLPGCPTNYILSALRKAGRRFCRESEYWRDDLASMNLVADQAEYTLTPNNTGEYILRVLEVRKNTDTGVTNGDEGALVDPVGYEYHEDTGVLEFKPGYIPTTAVTGGLDVKVALVPDIGDADIFPTYVANLYPEAIESACLSYLQAQTGKAWSNRDDAGLAESDYQKILRDAKTEIEKGRRDVVLVLSSSIPFII